MNKYSLILQSNEGGDDAKDLIELFYLSFKKWLNKYCIVVKDDQQNNIRHNMLKMLFNADENSFIVKSLTYYSGVIRVYRISPFDKNKRRHTSFFSLYLRRQQTEEEFNFKINEKDLKVETFRSSGAGGQHVNKTESAVRITHTPTGVVVQSQKERSQILNRKESMERLQQILNEREKKEKKFNFSNKEQSSGKQKLTFNFHPDDNVVNHINNKKIFNLNKKFNNGDLDEIFEFRNIQ